ncbi:MAG: cytochrome c [Acidobacteria bacterium]|nr:cytochrome c [Acidobacteriota bacterium]
MHDQPKYEAFEADDFFPDHAAARPQVANTVAHGFLRADTGYYTGADDKGTMVDGFPMDELRAHWPGDVADLSDEEFTRVVLKRGEQKFNTFCTPCHGRVGTGNGMIVQRGFKQPTSYHDERLRTSPAGYFVNVMTVGFGQMSSYASQVTPEERWAITAYIRSLQLSQSVRTVELDPDDLQRLEEPPADAAAGHGEHEAPAGDHSGEK